MQDQVSHSFLFTITPLEIINSSKSSKGSQRKSVLIKLGSKTEKTNQLKEPLKIQLDVLYSHTLKKYCPVKGIIKIYDIDPNGNEVISSVGGFQTEQLLTQNNQDIVIQRDVGTSKIKMRIRIENMGITAQCVTGKGSGGTLKTDLQKEQQPHECNSQQNPAYKYSPFQRSVKPAFRKSLGEEQLRESENSFEQAASQKPNKSIGSHRKSSELNSHGTTEIGTEIQSLKSQLSMKNQQIKSLHEKDKASVWKQLEEKERSLERLRKQFEELSAENKQLLEQNKKHKEKEGQMELIIFNKENMIQTLRQEIDEMNITYKEMEDTVSNDELIIQELREETANLNQTIEGYRSKYGDLKVIKDKALENELKDCLMWIDQQTRDFQEDLQTGTSQFCDGNQLTLEKFGQMIKNLQLQGASKKELTKTKADIIELSKQIQKAIHS